MARPIRPALVLTAAATVLAGCSGSPGTAAVVDGERVTDAEVAQAVEDYASVTGQEALPGAIVYTLVDGLVLNDIAGSYGLAYSRDEVVEYFTQVAESAGGSVPEDGLSPAFVELGRTLLVNSSVATDPEAQAIATDFVAARQAADVEVNPRYGEVRDGQLAPTSREWLATAEQ